MWRWVKVPKAIALIAFFLPWVTVSCSSTVLLTASGWSLASGHLAVVNPLTGITEAQQSEPNRWLISALIVIAIGLIASLLRRRAALVAMATSIAALVLIVAGTHRFSNRLLADEVRNRHPDQTVEQIAQKIRIDRQLGYWLELAALIAAGVMAGLTLTGRDRSAVGGHSPKTMDDDDAPLP